MRSCNEYLTAAAVLHDAGRFREALALYDQALASCSDSFAYWNNRGNSLLELNLLSDAETSYRTALSLCPDLADTRVALATCLQGMGKVDNALAECDAVLAEFPQHAEAHWNRGLLLLLSGAYEEGWREYEWRWEKRRFTSPRRYFDVPKWEGEDVSGRRLLIHAEQGFGDTIQFCRYLKLIKEQGAEIIFECHPPLTGLMKTLFKEITIVPFGRPLPAFDLHLPLLSLPRVFATTISSVPARIPYLSPPYSHLCFWKTLLPHDVHIKIGLCWKGKNYPDPGRSCPTDLLEPLGAVPGVTFYSLQTEPLHLPFSCTDVSPLLLDFSDTAALIGHLDLVITIDTAVAHLAGALGCTTWTMLPFAPDWRWGLDCDTTPWYPNMRLFRQREANGWQDMVERIVGALKEFQSSRA